MSKSQKSQTIKQKAIDSPAAKSREVKEIIELTSAELVSLVIPPFDKQVRTIDEVEAYTYSIFLMHQTSQEGYLRLRLDADIVVHFEEEDTEEDTIETSVQVLVEFRALDPIEEGKKFTISTLPNSIVVAAAHMAYSTARGLILAKAAGTILQDAVLPITSTSDLMAIKPNR